MPRQEEIAALRDKVRAREGIAGFKANVEALKARIAQLEAQA